MGGEDFGGRALGTVERPLPRTTVNAIMGVMSHSELSIGNPPDGTPHVLLVDDDPHLLEVLSYGLKRRGFHVISASTAKEALSLARPDVRIDLIIMDLVLPDSWGSQVVLELTQFRPDTRVLFISGYSQDDAVLGASSMNEAVDFLAKPFTVDELVARIQKALERDLEA